MTTKINPKYGISDKKIKFYGKRLFEKIYFHKKFREGIKRDFLDLENSSLKVLEDSGQPKSLAESKNRLLAEELIDLGEKYLNTIKKAEKQYKFYDQRGTFRLLAKGKTMVFVNFTLRDKKIREGNIIFEKGLPKKTYKLATVIKKHKEFVGYDEIDSGRYHFRQTGNVSGYFRYWGKRKKYFYEFDRGKPVKSNGQEMIILRFRVGV